jgi:hypothetical protein
VRGVQPLPAQDRAPLLPSAASYSARILASYSAVNLRCFGRSARGPMPPSSTGATSASVIVIFVLPISPRAEGTSSAVVSHLSLTHSVRNAERLRKPRLPQRVVPLRVKVNRLEHVGRHGKAAVYAMSLALSPIPQTPE